MISYRDELLHHGIRGQKWGKRNGPPYPLDTEDHSASEKKAGWRKSLDKKDKTRDNMPRGVHLTDGQKTALKIGAVAVAAGLAAYGAYKLGQTSYLGEFTESGKAAIEGLSGSEATIRKLDFSESHEQSLEAVNPTGNRHNCVNCTIAYFARQNGFDAVAPATEQGQSLISALDDCFAYKDPNPPHVVPEIFAQSSDNAKRAILRICHGDEDASGAINVSWKAGTRQGGENGSGHAFAWRVAKGSAHFFDPQNGVEINDTAMNWLLSQVNTDESIDVRRLDNASIKPEALSKYVLNR